MIGKSNAVLLALLLALPTAFLATAYIAAPAQAQPVYTAWLKIVTSAWTGTNVTGGVSPTLPIDPPIGPTGFANRYNVTNVCVEVYRIYPRAGVDHGRNNDPTFNPNWQRNILANLTFDGPVSQVSDRPNGTGFIRVRWPVDWQNVTIVVKARSYQGECIGAGEGPFKGIIVYWLTVNATEHFKAALTGNATLLAPYNYGRNVTLNDDGLVDKHPLVTGGQFDFNLPRAGYKSGPVDFLDNATGRGYDPKWFAGNFSTPGRAWVARAAYMFKVFHEHTWYGVKDNLTYATIFIYDTDHTPADSERSLIQAAVTGSDGQSRYTREIYPAYQGRGEFDSRPGRYADNRLVPIPLQILNLNNRTAFHGGIGRPEDNAPPTLFRVGAPHLNATKRVWWETVLVNQTFYVGNQYNGTGGYTDLAPALDKRRPQFGAFPLDPALNPTITQGGIRGVPAGPLSIALNHTVTFSTTSPHGFNRGTPWGFVAGGQNITNVANFNNNTVFYARFCVQDADMRVQHPQIGDKMVGAEVTLNFKTAADVPYYLAHSIHTTGGDGCINDPHKWPGYLSMFRNYARFPNGTDWTRRGSLNASYFFNPVDDASPVWRPGGYFERAWGGDWRGPYSNAGKNWSALIPEITYMKTRQLTDDPRWGGFEVQVKWKGGARNGYGGIAVLVDSLRIKNPYAIAATNTTTYNGWIMPNFAVYALPDPLNPTNIRLVTNNTVLIQIHNNASFTLDRKYSTNVPRPMTGPITLMLSSNIPLTIELRNYDPAAETFDIAILGPPDVDIRVHLLGNASVDGGGFINLGTGGEFEFIGVKASIKYHDAATGVDIADMFYSPNGWQDIGPDGIIESTAIDQFIVTTTDETGAAEVEIWPGAPGTQTLKSLISANNTDITLTAGIYNDFVGGMLFAGRPDPNLNPFSILGVARRNALWLSNIADNKAPDIALNRTGLVYITADVHDIGYRLVDNMGNPVPAANTAITLSRGNGGPITKSGAGGDPDFGAGGLLRSYIEHGEGWAVFYQLPEDVAYTVTVTFDGAPVASVEIPKLTETIWEPLVLNIFKVKIHVVDCDNSPVSEAAYVKVVLPSGSRVVQRLDSTGALDFGFMAGGELKIEAVWWKGVWVQFVKASIGERQLPLNPDRSLTVTIDSNIDAPIRLQALINDFIFTTWDFNKDNKIPRLNITLTWVGEHPFTGRKLYFLETMDPNGDVHGGRFNTSLTVSQFLNYTIRAYFGSISRSAGLKTYGDVRYVFTKMPAALYNITVTTVTGSPRLSYDPETQQTPGSSKWPGRTDAAVDHEIKIDWGLGLTAHDKAPTIRKTPAADVNDRVVLRVFMTMGGQPVTDPALNPLGNATLYTTCGPCNIDLLTWAHTFWQRIVDGDFDYLREARRIGNATYHIVNDNGRQMEIYVGGLIPFTPDFRSKWTEDTLLTTWLRATSQINSIIWWNGTYRKQDLFFLSYVYPLQFTRGEQPWARFYDKVGLTGSGWATTEEADADDHEPGDDMPTAFTITEFFNVTTGPNDNGKWPTHNFTVVGTEGLWNLQKWRWEYAVSKRLVPEVPYQPYSLVIERPTQDLVPVSEKGVLAVPIPVGFITLNLKDEDLARAIPYAVVQLDIFRRVTPPPPPGPFGFCDAIPIPSSLFSDPAAVTAIIASYVLDRTHPPASILDPDRRALCVEIYGQLTDAESPNAIDTNDAISISTMLNLTLSLGGETSDYNVTEIQLLINAIKGLVLDGDFTTADANTINDDYVFYFAPGFFPVDFSPFFPPSPPGADAIRVAGYKYKTGRDGNLTLLYPTQEAMANYLGVNVNAVKNYTLTVYWYLNSSIVYKDAFNLTKRGYNVEKVAIADVTFVLAISADKDRPVKDLYARIWWLNVTSGATTFPGRITVDHARKTWTYTAVPETRGAAKWTDGKITLPWLPTSERFTKTDYDLVFDTATNRWVYRDVTRSWDIPYPSYANGSMLAGWPYLPRPTGYYRALNFTQNARIQYRVSVWSDQLPIDPSLPQYGRGAWSAAAPNPATGYNYELVWTRLSTGDTTPPIFRFAWMLFGHPPFDITWYRGPDAAGPFEPIPGYALTRTWERTPTPGSKTVAIKLNATDIQIPVFWQVGDLELGTYDCGPLVDYVVKGQVIPPKGATFGPRTINDKTKAGTITVGDKKIDICLAGKPVGLVSLRSGDTPSTVIWGGSTLRITEVSPPDTIWADSTSPAAGKGTSSDYWKNWVGSATDPVTGKKVSKLWEEEPARIGDQTPGPDLGIQYMGYGVPYEGTPREHKVIAFSNDPDNRAHRPFIKMFEFQNVSARITDFNGRALPGALYQLVDAQTGKSAAWSYAGPEGRIVPMPIRKPGGVFIQRVFYLGHGPDGVPTWPVNSFAKWPVVYDSREDETTQETQKPDIPLGFAYIVEAGPWPNGPGWRGEICRQAGDGVYNYVRATLEALASCPPSGWGRSFDVITRIFDLRLRFVYGDAQRPADPYYEFSAPSLALPDQFKITGQGAIFDAKRLARGTYDIVAYWPKEGGAEVGRRTVDISRSNVGTVEGTVVLALRDVSFTVVDRQGRPLSGARVSVSPDLVRTDDIQLRPDQIFTLLRVPDGRTYDFTIEWTSPYGTTARAAVRETPAGLQARGSIVVPVDDISVKVVDFDGRPVAGAAIKFAGQDVGSTDSQGVIIVGQVPLDNDYTISVSKEGTEIGSDRVRFTASRTSATIQAGIYDITVLVKGAAGQPIQGATVELIKGGTTIATAATDASGTAVFTKLVGADYEVRAKYDPFSSTARLAKGVRSTTITLDLYTVLLGVPMTFATFLALIIGLILLVIVVVVIVSEYIRWRGRRLGIYPAAPPKK
jgi:hypothetical protein